jgi:uncharacterized membrane protein
MSAWLDNVYREVDAAASRADRAESAARRALLTGVFLAAGVLLLGLVLAFAQQDPRPNEPPAIAEMLRGLARPRGVAWIYAGLLLLAATPILRVIVMIGVYYRRREWFMFTVSLVVLGLLLVGLLLGTG